MKSHEKQNVINQEWIEFKGPETIATAKGRCGTK